jgi:hypothetical protein
MHVKVCLKHFKIKLSMQIQLNVWKEPVGEAVGSSLESILVNLEIFAIRDEISKSRDP